MTLANAMILVDQTAVPLALPDIIQAFECRRRHAPVGDDRQPACRWPACWCSGGRLAICSAGGGSSCSAVRCSPAPRRWPGWHRTSRPARGPGRAGRRRGVDAAGHGGDPERVGLAGSRAGRSARWAGSPRRRRSGADHRRRADLGVQLAGGAAGERAAPVIIFCPDAARRAGGALDPRGMPGRSALCISISPVRCCCARRWSGWCSACPQTQNAQLATRLDVLGAGRSLRSWPARCSCGASGRAPTR